MRRCCSGIESGHVIFIHAQARLLELLDLYPPEPIAQRRLEKISAALGSRTPRQVGSRLQKMFPDTKAARVLGRSSSVRSQVAPIYANVSIDNFA